METKSHLTGAAFLSREILNLFDPTFVFHNSVGWNTSIDSQFVAEISCHKLLQAARKYGM